MAFGAGGPHYCLGAHLARMELRLMIGELARRFPAMSLDGEPEFLCSNFVAGLESLPVRLA
ncbi:MAG: cytochrome P450 [Acidimicrobiia bacterium]|nr:cytochrome P450 [Acidimicrobiia bacterium]